MVRVERKKIEMLREELKNIASYHKTLVFLFKGHLCNLNYIFKI